MIFSKSQFFLFMLTLSVGLWSCNSKGISGKITGAEGEMLKIYELRDNKITALDSVKVNDKGVFSISTQGLEPNFYYLGFDASNMLLLFTDSTEAVVIEADKESLQKPKSIKGSDNSSKYVEFQELIEPLDKQISDINTQLNAHPVRKEKLRLEQEKGKILEEKRTACKKFVDNNKGNPITLVALQGLDIQKDMKYFDKVIRDTKPSIGNTKLHRGLSSQIKSIKKQLAGANQPKANGMAPGTTVPEIEMAGLDGKILKLSDLRGKVVLVDFWASWCGPCRRENPNVVAAYNKYNKDGFEVFSVSLDGNKDKWKAAIDKDGLIWPWHVSDLKKWNNAAANAYGVHSIPHGVLIDREGKVIAEKLRGAALQAKLAEIFGH